MTIETNFNLYDNAFVIYDNRIYEVVVTGIEAFTDHGYVKVNYKVRFPAGGETKMADSLLFATKQELINAL